MRIIGAIGAAILFMNTSAGAVTIRFGGINDPTNGLQTRFTDAQGNNLGVITFGAHAANQHDFPGRCYGPSALNVTAFTVDGPGDGLFYFDDSAKSRLAPAGSSNCYSVTDGTFRTGTVYSTTIVDPAAITTPTLALEIKPLTYLGFLWGSPDAYNVLQFVDEHGNVVDTINNFDGLSANDTLTGNNVYSTGAGGGYTSDPGNAGTRFINFLFDPSEDIAGVTISSYGNCCFELTNYIDSTDPVIDPTPGVGAPNGARAAPIRPLQVPEPSFALMIGLGLVYSVHRERRSQR